MGWRDEWRFLCVCVSSYTQGRWEGNNVSVLTHEPYHHIWKSWWGDLTGLFFWKPVLINVIELDFPRGGGYPKVGGQGNGYIQERTWGFLKKGMGMAAEKGNGGMKQMKDKEGATRQGTQVTSRSWEKAKKDSVPEPAERSTPCWHLDCRTRDRHIINLCCFQPQSGEQFVTAAIGSGYSYLYLNYSLGFHQDFIWGRMSVGKNVWNGGSLLLKTIITETLVSKDNSGDKECDGLKSPWG